MAPNVAWMVDWVKAPTLAIVAGEGGHRGLQPGLEAKGMDELGWKQDSTRHVQAAMLKGLDAHWAKHSGVVGE